MIAKPHHNPANPKQSAVFDDALYREHLLQDAKAEQQKLDTLIEQQRKRMKIQKEKLETQTLRKFKYGGTIHTTAKHEEDKEARRKEPHRYGVLRLR